MDSLRSFPFKIGEDAESKSHTDGFRGAWFRCKVKNMNMRGGELWCALEYYDYPGEKVRWTKVYQKDPADRNKMQLMMRPHFPHFYRECDILDDQNTETEAIINNEWEVGNLVDLWYDSCFWSGKIAAILDNNKVKVDLLKPPVGEGGSYDVDCKDLRPTLIWSIKSGWSVPLCKNKENFRPCVRLMSSLKGDPGPFFHMNSPAQDANSPWKRLVPQDSESVANMLPELRNDQGKDKKFRSHPDFGNHDMYTQTAKGISFGIGNPSSTCNLTELTQLLHEINGSKQFISDEQQNLRHGKGKCDLAVTTNCKDLPQNASGQNWQERRDESHEVGTSYICHGAVVPQQDWHVTRTTLDTDLLQCQRKPSNIQNSFHDMARNDCYQSIMNYSPSEKGRNVFSLSTYKKEQARVIVERAKSFHHGRGRLKRKNPAGEDRCLVSLDSESVMPSNKNEVALSVLSKRMSRNKDRKSSCIEIDEIESSVVALEELANKVKWLRGVMQFGFKQWSAVTETTWRFSDYQTPADGGGCTGK